MITPNNIQTTRKNTPYYFFILICVFSCDDFVDIDYPRTDLIKETVFTSDATAKAAVLDMYYQMRLGGFAAGESSSISFLTALSSDELINYNTSFGTILSEFYENDLTPTNTFNTNIWNGPFAIIYRANAILEGLEGSIGVSNGLKRQLEGEARFIRAFCFFYLVNLFGDIPLVQTTDYQVNASIPRTPKHEVYEQIINDLGIAQELMLNDYSFSNNERVRANKSAVAALMARVYLFTGDFVNAEAQATNVINTTALFNLENDLNMVFLKNSREAIWQLGHDSENTREAVIFTILNNAPSYGALNTELVSSFEIGDLRRTDWIGSVSSASGIYYYPKKYKVIGVTTPVNEYSMVLRLAEQYLIRAEARAQQDNIDGAQNDLNTIRSRAKLPPIQGSDKQTLLSAIEQERRIELFTEWGHRWLDLKRTGRVNDVLMPSKAKWRSTAALYPIPEIQILNDAAMRNAQNEGY